MKGLQWAAIAVAGFALSGCATIIQGTTENVSVSSTPEQGAQCSLVNSEGSWFLTTPGSTTVHKTKNDLTIDCTKTGYAPAHMVAVSHFGGTTLGNAIVGGAIGIGIDAASGANFYYDSPITVNLGASTQVSNATPPASSAPVAAAPKSAAVLMATPPSAAKAPVMIAANTASSPSASSPSVSTVTAPETPLHLDHAYPNYQPTYPDAAQVNGEQGNVVLNVEITSSGKVRNVKIDKSSGFDDLDNAAIAGVMRWRFIPSPYGSDWTSVTIAYRLPTAIIIPPKVAGQ
jgi:TonB family protein